ncbi:MAG: hypothetical protein ACPGYY_10195 [Bacteroidia bacterium]
MASRFFCISILCFLIYQTKAQDVKSTWSISSGYETNYTGNNFSIHSNHILFDKHHLGYGVNYNTSDGFSFNPVLGLGLSYGYKVVESSNWSVLLGLEYRRQKPLKIVNIQLINYTTTVKYSLSEKWQLESKVGYGVAAERAASAGSFAQSNNISGMFYFGCGYRL